MKKRVLTLLTALVMLLTMSFAGPVFADGYKNSPPNCEYGQKKAAYNAKKRGDYDQAKKHYQKAKDCKNGKSPGEGHDKKKYDKKYH
jgi:hypothetical protein